MTRTLHDGEDHLLFLPRAADAESWELLDRLLRAAQDGYGRRRSELVAAHAASLFAGISFAAGLENWPLVPESATVSPRWVQSVLGTEIDRIILRMIERHVGCGDCLIAWVRHLVEARITVAVWAWARGADDLLA